MTWNPNHADPHNRTPEKISRGEGLPLAHTPCKKCHLYYQDEAFTPDEPSARPTGRPEKHDWWTFMREKPVFFTNNTEVPADEVKTLPQIAEMWGVDLKTLKNAVESGRLCLKDPSENDGTFPHVVAKPWEHHALCAWCRGKAEQYQYIPYDPIADALERTRCPECSRFIEDLSDHVPDCTWEETRVFDEDEPFDPNDPWNGG